MCVCMFVCEGPGLNWSGPSKPISTLRQLTIVSPTSNKCAHTLPGSGVGNDCSLSDC